MWRRACTGRLTLGAPPWRNTILDKITEFAKISAGLNFCVRAMLRLRHSGCPPDTDVLKISSLPKRSTSQILMCPLSVNVSPRSHYGVPLRYEVANTTRGHGIVQHSAKADTKSIGHILCSGEHPERHCLSLSGQQIIRRARRTFSANS